MKKERNNLLKNTLILVAFTCIAQVVSAQATKNIVELVEPGEPIRIATGFSFTEGPVWHPDGFLLFTDIPGNSIYKWTPNGKVEKFRSPSGHSNGLTFDQQGRLIACEHSNRRISRTEKNGNITTLADTYDGKKLNSPNDAVVRSDGSIYFTDPPYGLSSAYGLPGIEELEFRGVYRLMPESRTLELLVDDIYSPNGLAFSPDEKVLYIADTELSRIYAFDVSIDGTLRNKRVFTSTIGGPDGIKVDVKGNLYVTTGLLAVRVYDSRGNELGAIEIPEMTRNCAFGGTENKTLFITASTSVYRVQLKVQGFPVALFKNER